MTEREDENAGRVSEPEVGTTVDEDQQAFVEPVGDAAARAVGSVSESAGEATRDAFAEGEKETTPLIAFTGVSLFLGAILAVLITAGLVLYFALGGR